MTIKELDNMIDEIFWNGETGYNCAQTVLICISKYFDMHNDVYKDIASSFGGGLSGTRISVCGAISGGLMFVGLKESGDRETSSNVGKELIAFVEEKYGHRCCDRILDIDFNNEEQVAKEKSVKSKSICIPLMKDICHWLVDKYED
jgi:C_GCAxxG_C_C family probable redox protein